MKRVLSFFLAVILLAAASVIPAAADSGEDVIAGCYKGVYYYRPGSGEFSANGDSVDYYVYSDDYFSTSAYDYNSHLASMSMAVGEASVSSTREPFNDAGYARKNRNIVALLDDLGFGEITLNNDYQVKPTKDSVGVACAHKQLTVGGESYTLLAVMPRNAGYEAEWGNNFVLGPAGDAAGFDSCAEKVLAFTKDYIAEKNLQGNIKIWTVGYSRGAAIVDLIAKRLIDSPAQYLGAAVTLAPENLYAYTFGTPSAADVNNDPANERYRGIFNHCSDCEIAGLMPPVEMGFGRYGTVYYVNQKEKQERMLQLLSVCNPEVHAAYVGGDGPDFFTPKQLGYVDGSLALIDDEDSYIPSDTAEYLHGLSQYLNQFVGGREGYSAGGEQPFSDLLAYYESLTGDRSDALMDAVKSNKDTLSAAVSMYAYFMRLKSTGTAKATSAQAARTVKEIASTAALGVRLMRLMRSDPAAIRAEAAGYLKSVLTGAMQASGATEAEIASVTSQEDLEALVHLLSHLLLGNIWQSDEVHPYLINNEQLKNLATLIGNFTNLFSDHMNEALISWVRVDDSYYDDYAPLTAAQLAGYRRVYLRASNGALLNGEVLNAKGEKVAAIRDGVLVNVADAWIGFTTTDDGGFLRVPMGESYSVALSADAACTLNVRIDEYDCYEAQTVTALTKTKVVPAGAAVTVELPAPDEGFAIPSGAAYAVKVEVPDGPCLLGDADGDGTVTVMDATCIQRHLADIPTDIFQEAAADTDEDGAVSVLDATEIQRWLAGLPANKSIGKPMNHA